MLPFATVQDRVARFPARRLCQYSPSAVCLNVTTTTSVSDSDQVSDPSYVSDPHIKAAGFEQLRTGTGTEHLSGAAQWRCFEALAACPCEWFAARDALRTGTDYGEVCKVTLPEISVPGSFCRM